MTSTVGLTTGKHERAAVMPATFTGQFHRSQITPLPLLTEISITHTSSIGCD